MKETKDFTIKPDLDRMGLFKEVSKHDLIQNNNNNNNNKNNKSII